MIRINLLKSSASRRRKVRKPLPKAFVVVPVVAVAVGAVGWAGWMGRSILLSRQHAAVTPKAPTGDMTPSSLVSSTMVEEVVRDVTDEREKLTRSGYLDLPYEQFSVVEKINFEELFAKEACELLIRCVPEQVGLRSLEISNYRTVYAVGLSSSKEQVNNLFAALKREKVELLAPPLSFIKPNGGGGYRFAFTCDAQWGLGLNDPCADLSMAAVPPREALDRTISRFVAAARKAKVDLRGAPERLTVEKLGGYRRYEYRCKAAARFVDLVELVKGLCSARVPCAFKSLEIAADANARVGIDAVVVFTTLD